MEFRKIQTRNLTLNVAEFNPAGEKTVVLLHGFPEFWAGWRQQASYLALKGFHVLVPDQRGYNLSDKPEGVEAYAMTELTSDVVSLIRQTGKEKVYLAGHDWGGMVAWNLAICHPYLIEKLAVVNAPHPVVMGDYLKNSLKQRAKSWYAALFQLPYLPEALTSAFGYSLLDATMRNTARANTFTEHDLAELHEAWQQPGALTAMLNWYRALTRAPFHYDKNAIVEVSTLIIWGAEDAFLDTEMALPSMMKCSGGRLDIIENASHWVLREEPVRTSKLLADFFE